MRESLKQFLFTSNLGLSLSISSQFTLFCSQKSKKKSWKTDIFRIQSHLRSSTLIFLRSSSLVLVIIRSMSVHICNYFHA